MNLSGLYTANDHFTIAPAIMMTLFGCAILLFDFFPFLRRRRDLLMLLVIAEAFAG
jgi:NADH-quinone oxidoreductase subunit N